MSFSLIIPAAADTEKYQTEMPYIFSLDHEGIMLCVRAIILLEIRQKRYSKQSGGNTYPEAFLLKMLMDTSHVMLSLQMV